MLATLLLALAHAAEPAAPTDAIAIDPPLPITGLPWDVVATAYALPVADASWIVSEAPVHTCTVAVTFTAGDTPVAVAGADCPPAMADPCVAATRAWRFLPAEDAVAVVPTRFVVRYEARYEDKLGTLTLHAEVDPGREAAFAGAEGVPGVWLVHPATPKKPVVAKLPRGAEAASCTFVATLDTRGRVAETAPKDCPEPLARAAAAAVLRSRWSPLVVNGAALPATVLAEVRFR